ncbi:MAG: Holliday junction branch migration protein RuvA [Deltaproteobacteria bacterium]|nr:MAG: Holliday junction branch migration protein RuvA [Deltaproteobacteria bacterium]
MISSLRGKLILRAPDLIIVEIGSDQSAIGYRVAVSQYSFNKLPMEGSSVFLWIHTSVREDDISLFGFIDDDERRMFQKLITVNGIGPKLALTILSGMPPRELSTALFKGDLAQLTSISGIGKKTAERMVLDLKDKMIELMADLPPSSHSTMAAPILTGNQKLMEEALSALQNLGYYRAHAEKVLLQIPMNENTSIESIIRQALRTISK